MIKYIFKNISNFLVFIAFTFFSLVCSEMIMRVIDGYPLFCLKLGDKPKPKIFITDKTQASKYLKNIPLKENYDIDLFLDDPPLLPTNQPDIFLMSLFKKAQNSRLPWIPAYAIKEWNKFFLVYLIEKGEFCNNDFNQYPSETVIFEPCENSFFPYYRFPQNVTMPTGLVTNNFGWRGHELKLNKPENTIRLCFLGASTTVGSHNFPHSYPEFIEHWLNVWAKNNRLNIRFEIMNTAREATASSDIEAIFRQEAAFLEPDIVIYYEGANQFHHFNELLKTVKPSPPNFGSKEQGILFIVNKTQKYSAMGRRLKELLLKIYKKDFLSEPPKPNYILEFPVGIDEYNPDIFKNNLPLDLSTILRDLDSIHKNADRMGCQFVLTSFIYLPYKGLIFERTRQQLMYNYINRMFWPLTYSDIKRLADFQNRVFSLYAIANHIDFIDVSYFFPRDSDLFIDTVHFTEDGMRIQAWITFQGLLPIIRKSIESGKLPRPDQEYIMEHPCIRKGMRNGFSLLKEAANGKENSLK
jgi:hypothetical protein